MARIVSVHQRTGVFGVPTRMLALLAFAALVSIVWVVASLSADNASALWRIVHDQCAPHQERAESPAPCAAVDLESGAAVLKDRVGVAQHLLIPLWRSPGVEDPRLIEANARNLWKDGWEARPYLERALGRKIDDTQFGMAINARPRRSQDQFHIHLDCLRPAVSAALPRLASLARDRWQDVGPDVLGADYRVLVKDADDLDRLHPFALLAQSLSDASQMQDESLAVVSFKPGEQSRIVLLIASRFDLAHPLRGHAEDLLDHTCGAG